MPYKLRKAPKRDLYWVINTDTKKKHSNEPLPKDRAEAQMRALYAAEGKEGKGKTPPPKEAPKEAPKAPERPADKRPPREIPAHLLAPLQLEAPQAAPQAAPSMGGPGSAFKRTGKGKYSPLARAVLIKQGSLDDAEKMYVEADKAVARGDMAKAEALAEEAGDLERHSDTIARNMESYADVGRKRSGKKPARVSRLGPALQKVAGSPAKAARFLKTPAGQVQKSRTAAMGSGKTPSDSGFLRKRFPFRTLSMTNLYKEWNNARQEAMLKSTELKRFEELVAEYRKSGYRKMPVQAQKIIRKQQELDEATLRFKKLQKEIERRGDVDIPETIPEEEEEEDLEGNGRARFLANIQRKHKLDGAGIFGSILDRARKTVSGAFSLASNGIRKQYSPSAKAMLGKYANAQIVELAVRRDPIQAFLDVALNAITLGKWSQAKSDLSYDKLFHLGLVVGVKQQGRRTNLIVEKNEVINIADAKRPVSGTEFYHVPLRGKQMTFSQFMQNAEQAKGTEFFLYDAFENNCQDFVAGLLSANGLLDENAATFIKQPIDQLMRKLPSYTQKLARKITDLGAAANVVLEGSRRRRLRGGAKSGEDAAIDLRDYAEQKLREQRIAEGMSEEEADEAAGEDEGQEMLLFLDQMPVAELIAAMKAAPYNLSDNEIREGAVYASTEWALPALGHTILDEITGHKEEAEEGEAEDENVASELNAAIKKVFGPGALPPGGAEGRGRSLKGLLDGAGVGHIFETRFNPKTGFFHRPFEPMSGAGPLFFLKGRGSDRGRYYIRPDLTIPDLANFLNEMTAPNEIAGILAKLESPTEMGAQNQGRTNYNFYRDYEAQAMETADNLEKLVNEQYDQSMEMLNAFRSQKPQGLGALVNAIGQGIAVFRTLKGISSPIGALKFGAESLGSLLNAAFSGDLYRVAPQTSYSYSQQLQGELSSILGPAGQVGAQIAGTLGELFGAKSQAERNDPYVESVIRAKRDEALPLIQQFRQRWQDNLRATKSQEERMDVANAANIREGDLRHQYEKEVFWMDRLSPADWSDRFEGEARSADRPYVSFDSWKAKKGYGREPVIKMKRKDFIAEHKKLIALLEKVCSEGREQAAELASMTGGGTHRQNFLKANKLADKSYSLAQLSKISSVPKSILQQVYNRGVGAYKTQPKSVRLKGSFVKNVDAPMSKKLSKEQWGMARVYSFLDGNPRHDEDLRRNRDLVGGQPEGDDRINKKRLNETAGDAIRSFPGNTRLILEMRDQAQAELDAGEEGRDVLNRFFDRLRTVPGAKQIELRAMLSRYKAPKEAAAPAAAPAEGALPLPPGRYRVSYPPQQARKDGSGRGIVFRSLEKSNKAGKKWRVNLTVDGRSRTIHFGAAGMDDFTKKGDKAQKQRYLERHQKRENWTKSGIATPGFWSRWILWNKPTIAESLADARKRFKL